MRLFLGFYIFTLALFSASCSKAPPPDDGTVSDLIENRINSLVNWEQGYCQGYQVQEFISSAFLNKLTADTAIQIALLNNPTVQATFEELGIAQADLVEAGLLSNPSFELEVRYPHVKKFSTNIEYLITSSLLDIFLIPLRTKLASTEFEQTKLRVSNEILNLAFEVRKTYYELLLEKKRIQYIRSNADLTDILCDISSKQLDAGNVNTLEFLVHQSRLLETELELSYSQVEIVRLKEKLNRLLGFPLDVCLTLPEDLPDLDYIGFDLCALESIALEKRLDLQMARLEITRFSQMLGLKSPWTYTNLKAGVAGEKDPDGLNLIGPGFSGEIPLFNYGQAARMRLFSQLRQAQDKLAELEIKVVSEVRQAHKQLTSYLKIIDDYETRLLPVQSEILASSEDLYNVMGLGIDKLLENKRQEVIALQNYTESVKKYLVARVELDCSLGGYLLKLLAQMEYVEEPCP